MRIVLQNRHRGGIYTNRITMVKEDGISFKVSRTNYVKFEYLKGFALLCDR
jgi:hypothetical protein